MNNTFKLYKVDMKYIRNLQRIDDKVLSVSPQRGKDNRVFVGIVVICGKHKYCIPLSSPKKKHLKMRNSIDFSKIIVNGKLIGVLNFNLMIPIEEKQLQIIDTIIYKRDRENIEFQYQNVVRANGITDDQQVQYTVKIMLANLDRYGSIKDSLTQL